MSTQISISPVIKLEVNTTPITGGSAGQILFQTTGNTVGESANLSWNNTNLIFTLGSTATRIFNFRPEDTTGTYGNSCSIRGGNGNGRLDFYSASNITEVRDNIVLLTSVSGPAIQVGSTINLNLGGSTRLQVASTTGNILIGTTTDAGFLLDVNGTARVGTLRLNSVGDTIEFNNTLVRIKRSSNRMNFEAFDGFDFTDTNISTTRIRIFGTTGNVGINTTTDAGFRLDVNGTARVQGNTNISGFLSATNYLECRSSIFLRNSSGGGNTSFTTDTTNCYLVNSATVDLQIGYSSNYTFRLNNASRSIGIQDNQGGAATTDASALLTLTSTTKGFLPPRMTNAQRAAIASPAVGLMVYQTDGTEGLYVYKSTGWALNS